MEQLDTLKKEVAETAVAVTTVVTTVKDTVERVNATVDALKSTITALQAGTVSPDDLAKLAADLDGRQTELAAVVTALNSLAPAAVKIDAPAS